MAKGKKFDAAEKHFQEKEIKLRQEMREMQRQVSKSNTCLAKALDENEKLKQENAKLKVENDKLLKLCKLSESELQELLSVSRAKQSLSGAMLFNALGYSI